MADRGHRGGGRGGGFRGRGGGHRGRGGGGGGGEGGSQGHHHGGHYRGGAAHGHGRTASQDLREKPKKENILDLTKYMDKEVLVLFNGGRQVTGTLKGYDALMNLVLDEGQETMRNAEGEEQKRSLGLVVVRGTLLVSISPLDGSEPIDNPFLKPTIEEDDDSDD